MDSEVPSDYTCMICLRLLYEPVKLECSHSFCGLCLKKLLRSTLNKACPLCRRDLADFDQENAKPDASIENILKKQHASLLAKRQQEHVADIEEEKHKIVKKLIVGNDCVNAPGGDKDWKKWTLYLHFEGDEQETGKFIEKVVVKLHETFRPPVLEFKKPPFEVSRVGWGVFEINMTLHFQSATKKHPMDISWYLSFRDGGRHKIVDLEFDDRYLPGSKKD